MKRKAWEGGELTLSHIFLVNKFAFTLGGQALVPDGPSFACIAKVVAGLTTPGSSPGRRLLDGQKTGTGEKLFKTSPQ